ncbi:hypothetical protein [Mergibacter septicus]|uniref:hypothetical protein n=1 Tax=Mergibacter septicus TaxID=221402 RepID=UPI00223FC382|nr:hypothetical protein [Mergibacter septicus]
MPAEHLTKKRLIQLLVMMILLLSAFFYRTFYPVNYHQGVKKIPEVSNGVKK